MPTDSATKRLLLILMMMIFISWWKWDPAWKLRREGVMERAALDKP